MPASVDTSEHVPLRPEAESKSLFPVPHYFSFNSFFKRERNEMTVIIALQLLSHYHSSIYAAVDVIIIMIIFNFLDHVQ